MVGVRAGGLSRERGYVGGGEERRTHEEEEEGEEEEEADEGENGLC